MAEVMAATITRLARGAALLTAFASLAALKAGCAYAQDTICTVSSIAAMVPLDSKSNSERVTPDVPRVELAARLSEAGLAATGDYKKMWEAAARELAGRPDGASGVSADELRKADNAIARQIQIDKGTLPPPSFAEVAKSPGRPQIEGLNIVYLNPLGDVARANAWKNIIAHQSEGPPGTARREASDQFANPTSAA
jgi:hypothetical protein